MKSQDFELIQQAIAAPEEFQDRPELENSLQRWAGTDSKRFFAVLTKKHARELLLGGADAAGGALDPELDVWCQTLSPGKKPELGPLRFGRCPTPFGQALMILSEHGIVALRFGEENDPKALLPWKDLEMTGDNQAAGEMGARIFEGKPGTVPVHLLGTAFQIIVWQALLSIPSGTLTTYQKLAQQIGRPDATRAVASAVARNGIGYLVPCHRVIQTGGGFGEYRWGSARKQAMIAWENVAADVGRRV